MSTRIQTTTQVGTSTFTIERSAMGQVVEYDVYVQHRADDDTAKDRMYLGGGTKREARKIFHRAVKQQTALHRRVLADALIDAAAALADEPDATDDLIGAENDILVELNVPLEESEQGLTVNAARLVYEFARKHTSKSALADRVLGDPKDPREMELLQEDIAERHGGIAMGVNPRPLKPREGDNHSENQLIAEAFGKDGAVRFVPVEGEKPGRPFILNSDAVEKLYETLARIR